MRVVKQNNDVFVLGFKKGEEVMSGLKDFCEKENIKAGYLSAIGAASRTELGFYVLERKEYDKVEVNQMTEIASMTGNVAMADGEVIVHAHGVFSTSEKVWAGHVFSLEVGVTCEVVLRKLDGEMKREMDEEIGLKLLTSPGPRADLSLEKER